MSFVSKLLTGIVKSRGKANVKKRAPLPLKDAVTDFIKEPVSDKFTVGFSKKYILPDDIEKNKYYIAGYGENNPARGVIDPPVCPRCFY